MTASISEKMVAPWKFASEAQFALGNYVELQPDATTPKVFRGGAEYSTSYAPRGMLNISLLLSADPDANVAIINQALIDYDIVEIDTDGDVLTRKITIPSNTHLKLGVNTVLKLADNTADYMIVNSDTVGGNVNIEISGGTLNQNQANGNGPTGAWDVAYPGHCVFLYNVVGLRVYRQKHMGAAKYAYLFAEVENEIIYDIEFLDASSDGLHHLPPCKNVSIDNIRGKTGDDMIAFTLGDYEDYQVTNEGDFENISITNIFPDDAKATLKLTGSGAGNAYKFKNISADGVFGSTTDSAFSFIDDNAPQANGNLSDTFIESVKISNVGVTVASGAIVLCSVAADARITMENITISENTRLIDVQTSGGVPANVSKIIATNILYEEEIPLGLAVSAINIRSTCKALDIIVNGFSAYLYLSSKIVEMGATSSYRLIDISNFSMISNQTNYINHIIKTDPTTIAGGIQNISNGYALDMERLFLNQSPCICNISNFVTKNADYTHYTEATANQAGKVKYNVSNYVNESGVTASLSQGTMGFAVSGDGWECDALELTPDANDTITNSNAGLGTGAGVLLRNSGNTEWKNLYTGLTA